MFSIVIGSLFLVSEYRNTLLLRSELMRRGDKGKHALLCDAGKMKKN